MSLSTAEINSQIQPDNFKTDPTHNNSFILTITHDVIKKEYLIKINDDNRVVSSTRINPSTSTWERLKTALANFFGKSNNVRIARAMNNKLPNEIALLKEEIIRTNTQNNLARDHKLYINKSLDDFTSRIDDRTSIFDPLNNKEDREYAQIIYKLASDNNRWEALSWTILSRTDDALIASAIAFGANDFFDNMLTMAHTDNGVCAKLNGALNTSHNNCKKLAEYINKKLASKEDQDKEVQKKIKSLCQHISKEAINNLIFAGAETYNVLVTQNN